MALIATLETRPTSTPSLSDPGERRISGDPRFMTWLQAVVAEKIRVGVWEASTGEHLTVRDDAFEFCHILSGIIEITPEKGETLKYFAGDNFILEPGFRGVWKTIEPVKKIFVTVKL